MKAASAKSNNSSIQSTNTNDLTCIVAKGTTIEGTFKSTQNARIDGKLIGTILCDQKLIIGVSGEIEGDIITNAALIKGTVNGTLKIKSNLTLDTTAKVNGTIETSSIEILEGADFKGTCSFSK